MIFEFDEEQSAFIKSVNEHYDLVEAIIKSKPWTTQGGKIILNFNLDGVLTSIVRPNLEFGEILWERKRNTA